MQTSTVHVKWTLVKFNQITVIYFLMSGFTFKSLKSRLEVIQNGTIRKLGYSFLFAFYSNYSRTFSWFWDIQHQIIALPRNMGLGSFNVTENDAVR